MATVSKLRQKFLSKLPAWEADQLLQISCNKDKTFILTHPEYKLSVKEFILFIYFFYRFKNGEPLAYLTGHKEFYGLDFIINKYTLIPRPDTEIMVEESIKILAGNKDFQLIDIGTGSGCVVISILKNLAEQPKKTLAIDISSEALKIAALNSLRHGIKIDFIKSDLLSAAKNNIFGDKILITANLPYLTQEQFKKEPSIQREPKSALIADEGGLAYYRKLLEQIKELNKSVVALFEIDPDQTLRLIELVSSILPGAKTEIKTDLAGRDRLVKIEIN
jgi:release factor glutamine methyltransferase